MPVVGKAKSDHSQAKAQAERSEFGGFLPLTDFYNTPSPLPAGNPGLLIRSEVFDEYELPPGVSAVRILYHSRSALGEDIATSGVVLVPDERPLAGGWPVIAWGPRIYGYSPPLRSLAHEKFI
jgi:hypothetical protein